jgi:hypothetical protein
VFDKNQNLRQTYAVTKQDRRLRDHREHDGDADWEHSVRTRTPRNARHGHGAPEQPGARDAAVQPGDNGENRAKEGVASEALLDPYTKATITPSLAATARLPASATTGSTPTSKSIFDLDFTFSGPNKPFDSQGGFNVHTIVLQIR